MAMTPKQLAQYKKDKEAILALEKKIEAQIKVAGNLSGEEYQRMKDKIKANGKLLEQAKAREKAQDEINKKTKLLNEEKDKSKLIDMDVKETQKEINDLANLLLKNSNKLTKSQRERLTTEISRRKVNMDAAKFVQMQVDLEEKLQMSSFAVGENFRMAKEQAILMTRVLLKNPLMIAVAAGYALGKALGFVAEQAKSFRDNVGTSVITSGKLVAKLAGAKAESMLLGYNISEISNNIVDSFGTLDNVSNKSVRTIGQFEKVLGVTPEHSAGVMMQMQKVAGLSEEASISAMKNLAATAETNNIPIGKLFEDLSSSSEEVAAFGGENLENIKRAAVEARRMGVNLSTTMKIADKLLDFETSIAGEMEASLMIGKQLNFNRARQLALEGDVAGAARDVVKQIGGQAEFAKLNVLQRRALADSIGVSVDELSKLSSGKVEFKKPKETAEEQLLNKTAQAAAATAENSDKMGLLTAAVFGLTAVMGAKLLKELGGLSGIGTMMGKGLNKMGVKGFTKSGGLDKRTKLGQTLRRAKPNLKAAPSKVLDKAKGLAGKAKGAVSKGVGVVGKGLSAGKGAVTKAAGKGVGKSLLKKIPGVGLIAGLGFAASRIMKGDALGAFGEVASGVASLVPGIGTAVSATIDAGLMAKDISSASKDATDTANEVAKEASKNIEKVAEAQPSGVVTETKKVGGGTLTTTTSTTSIDTPAALASSDPEFVRRQLESAEHLLELKKHAEHRLQARAERDGVIDAREANKIKRYERQTQIMQTQVDLLTTKLNELISATKNVGKDVANQATQ